MNRCEPEIGCYATVDPQAGVGTPRPLATGRRLTDFPFRIPRNFQSRGIDGGGVDPFAYPEVIGKTCDVYFPGSPFRRGMVREISLQDAWGQSGNIDLQGEGILSNALPSPAVPD